MRFSPERSLQFMVSDTFLQANFASFSIEVADLK